MGQAVYLMMWCMLWATLQAAPCWLGSWLPAQAKLCYLPTRRHLLNQPTAFRPQAMHAGSGTIANDYSNDNSDSIKDARNNKSVVI